MRVQLGRGSQLRKAARAGGGRGRHPRASMGSTDGVYPISVAISMGQPLFGPNTFQLYRQPILCRTRHAAGTAIRHPQYGDALARLNFLNACCTRPTASPGPNVPGATGTQVDCGLRGQRGRPERLLSEFNANVLHHALPVVNPASSSRPPCDRRHRRRGPRAAPPTWCLLSALPDHALTLRSDPNMVKMNRRHRWHDAACCGQMAGMGALGLVPSLASWSPGGVRRRILSKPLYASFLFGATTATTWSVPTTGWLQQYLDPAVASSARRPTGLWPWRPPVPRGGVLPAERHQLRTASSMPIADPVGTRAIVALFSTWARCPAHHAPRNTGQQHEPTVVPATCFAIATSSTSMQITFASEQRTTAGRDGWPIRSAPQGPIWPVGSPPLATRCSWRAHSSVPIVVPQSGTLAYKASRAVQPPTRAWRRSKCSLLRRRCNDALQPGTVQADAIAKANLLTSVLSGTSTLAS